MAQVGMRGPLPMLKDYLEGEVYSVTYIIVNAYRVRSLPFCERKTFRGFLTTVSERWVHFGDLRAHEWNRCDCAQHL